MAAKAPAQPGDEIEMVSRHLVVSAVIRGGAAHHVARCPFPQFTRLAEKDVVAKKIVKETNEGLV